MGKAPLDWDGDVGEALKERILDELERRLEVAAQGLGLLVEEGGRLARGCDAQLDRHVHVGLGKGVGGR